MVGKERVEKEGRGLLVGRERLDKTIVASFRRALRSSAPSFRFPRYGKWSVLVVG